MSNETIFFIFGIALAVSAVLVSFAGLKLKDFPGKALPVIVLWFVILVGGSTTFAVLHAKDEDKAKGAEYEQAGKELEKAESSGPFEQAEKEAAEEGGGEEAEEGEEGGEASAAEPGREVFIANGCGSCHTFAAAGTTGAVGPDLNESLAPDDDAAGIEEMIVDPEAEIAEGYSGGIMPTNFGETIPKEELQELVQFLVNNSRAGGEEEEGAGGEEEDVGGPNN
jgi:mono/diheme cytochrome c family protein